MGKVDFSELSVPNISTRENISALFTLSDNRRPVGFLIMAALALGLPLFLGALLGHYSTAILAGMGGLSILYMPQSAIHHGLITMAVVSFGFDASFTLGVLTSFDPIISSLTLGLTALFAATILESTKMCGVP